MTDKEKIQHGLVSQIIKDLKYIQQTQSNLPNQSKSVQMCINAVKKYACQLNTN